MLFTEDGGANWSNVPAPELSSYSCISFIDAHRGWALSNTQRKGRLEIECSRISGNSSVQCANNDCGPRTVTVTALSAGHVVDTSTFFAPDDWDGSMDGTYSVNSQWAKRVFARWDGGGQLFVNFMMWRGGADEELFWRKRGGGSTGQALSYNGFLQGTKTTTEDNPPQLQGDNNGPICGIVVTFAPGTTYPDSTLPNGPSIVPDPKTGQPSFGLGFSVSGWVGSGGIGWIGSDTAGVKNPANKTGQWRIDQETSAWIGINGQKLEEKPTFSDINPEVHHHAVGNTFGWYDHPGATAWPAGYSRFENHIVKVYSGKTVCEISFHFIQHGNSIRWGRGLL